MLIYVIFPFRKLWQIGLEVISMVCDLIGFCGVKVSNVIWKRPWWCLLLFYLILMVMRTVNYHQSPCCPTWYHLINHFPWSMNEISRNFHNASVMHQWFLRVILSVLLHEVFFFNHPKEPKESLIDSPMAMATPGRWNPFCRRSWPMPSVGISDETNAPHVYRHVHTHT